MSLGKKNTLYCTVALIVVFALCVVLVYFQSRSQLLTSQQERAATMLNTIEAEVAGSQAYNIDDFFIITIQPQLDVIKKSIPELKEITIYSIAKGSAIASTTEERRNKKIDTEDTQAAKDNRTVVLITNEGGEFIVDVTAPLHINGKIDYVAGIQFSLKSEMATIMNQLWQIILFGLISLAAIAFLLWFFNIRKTSKQIQNLMKISNEISKGNLTVRAKTGSRDEIGKLAGNINSMSDALSGIIRNVMESAGKINSHSLELAEVTSETSASIDDVAKTIDDLAQGASNQTSEAKNGFEKLLALAERINNALDSTAQIEQLAGRTGEMNEQGKIAMKELEEKLAINNNASKQIADKANSLLVKSSSISQVTDTIQSIAEQTNLLALNAAIEAARAGEQGKGFAVVADEIRKLAEQTSASTKSISTTIKEIQSEVNATKNNIDMGAASLSMVNQTLVETTKAFEAISIAVKNSIEHVDVLVQNIKEINENKDEVVNLIQEISDISDNTAASAEEVSASIEEQTATIEGISVTAENMKNIAAELDQIIGGFRI